MSSIAFLGPQGTFSEQAVDTYLKNNGVCLNKKACVSFHDVFNELLTQPDCSAMIPIENSIEGGVSICTDYLARFLNVYIVAEQYLTISHCLISHQLCDLNKITHIYSHPQALGQCRDFLKTHCRQAKLIATESTSAAVENLKNNNQENVVAMIGSFPLISMYQLHLLKENIQDVENNQTRFVLLSKSCSTEQATRYKTSLILAMDKQVPGSLYQILSQFNQYQINLTRIESRPFKREMGEYLFYIDFEGHYQMEHVKKCLKSIESQVYFFKNLGSYPFVNPL